MKFPEFTSIDFSKLDINALRKIDLSKYVPDIDLPAIDTEKLTAALRDAGYLAVVQVRQCVTTLATGQHSPALSAGGGVPGAVAPAGWRG